MNKPMKILVIANLPPYVLGGAENQVARLVETWCGMGHHVEVAGHRIPDGLLALGNARVRTHHIGCIDGFRRGGRAASYFLSTARLMRKLARRFEVIYCRGLGDGAISICLLKAMGLVHLPLLATPINAKGAGDANFIRSIPGWKHLVKLVNTHCEAINIIAPAILPDVLQLGLHSPSISHIPNGIALGEPTWRSNTGQVRRFIWVGRLSTQKGLDILLVALSKVLAQGKDFRLEIIGDGPERSRLMRLCQQLALDGKVRFTGALASGAIRPKLLEADVFILPSRYEGMSNAALEAMEAGLPVLLTRCGGIDTYIDVHTGWVCEPDDADQLTEAVLRVLETPDADLLAMGRQARLLVERRFCIHGIARENADLMNRLIVPETAKYREGVPGSAASPAGSHASPCCR